MIYKRIRDLREDRDLTQREMGIILSASRAIPEKGAETYKRPRKHLSAV